MLQFVGTSCEIPKNPKQRGLTQELAAGCHRLRDERELPRIARTLHSVVLNTEPLTLNFLNHPKAQTPNPKPQTTIPKPQSLNPKP